MKLQVNTRGAWKNVCDFPLAKYFEVRDAATRLGAILGDDGRFCIVDDVGRREWLNDAPGSSRRPR